MIALFAAVVLSGQAPAIPLAAGPDVFPDFQAMCVAHRGDLDAPIAAADAKGWTTVPEAMIASQLPKGVKNGKVRVKIGDGGIEYVFTGAGEYAAPAVGAIQAKICFLGAQPGDFTGAVTKAAAFARIEPVAKTEKGVVYAFSDAPDGHKPLNLQDQTTAAAALKSGSTTLMIVQSTQHGAGVQLGYAVPSL